jgi:hypothetical protein
MMASPATSVCKWHTSGNYRPETNDSFAPERGQPRPVEKNDGKGARRLVASYGQKLVTASRGKAAYRGGVQRLHISNEGVIRRVRQ